ncbi:MAG: hypothetical protein CFE27_14685 [Alphaproteobacteria bacterium PA1]|nr:MAG: hypothetical protein CFE27_14685 [Alphaproteobacteria bacterium PA1]
MTNPVAPVSGHYALLRNGEVHGPLYQPPFEKYPIGMTVRFVSMHWDKKGKPELGYDDYDIISTISPADMQAVASGELERLRAALKALHDGLAWDWRGHPVGDLPTLREIARTALEGGTV